MGVTSVTIAQRNGRTEIYSNYGWVTVSCSATLPSNTSSGTSRATYSNLRYTWSFYRNNASTPYCSISKQSNSTYDHNCTNIYGNGVLSPGAQNQIKVKVTVTCTQAKEKYVSNPLGGGAWFPDGTDYDYEVGELSSSNVNLFTRTTNNSWSWGVSSNQTIQSSNLGAANLSDWISYLGKWRSWKAQNDLYDNYSTLARNAGDLITASWFNACYKARHISNDDVVTGGANGTIITATLINQLNFSSGDWV